MGLIQATVSTRKTVVYLSKRKKKDCALILNVPMWLFAKLAKTDVSYGKCWIWAGPHCKTSKNWCLVTGKTPHRMINGTRSLTRSERRISALTVGAMQHTYIWLPINISPRSNSACPTWYGTIYNKLCSCRAARGLDRTLLLKLVVAAACRCSFISGCLFPPIFFKSCQKEFYYFKISNKICL